MSTRRHALVGLSVAMAVALAPPARAHGPTRQKLIETVDVAASPEKVWSVIVHFHDLSWHPLVVRVTGEGGDSVGATRQVSLKSGGELDEELTKFDAAGMAYATFLPRNDPKVLPVTNFSAEIKVEPAGGGAARVTWRGAFYRGYPNADPPADLNEAAAIAAVKAYFRAGLDALKQRVETGS